MNFPLEFHFDTRLKTEVATRGGLVIGTYDPEVHGSLAGFRREMASA